jgi:hypothetical protein
MSTATAQAPPDHFIPAAQAIRENPGLTHNRLYRLGLTQQVRVQLTPGLPPRYSRTDLRRVLATVSGGAA